MTEETERLQTREPDAFDDRRDEAADDAAPSGERSLEDVLGELDEARREASELLDSLQRSRAEFVNYRRRVEQEQERNRIRATESVIRKLLPVADDFDRALRSVPEEISGHPWIEGIRLVERKLWHVLESGGVSVMESIGQPFDPSRHEAVMVDEEAGAADTVVEEFQRGYLIGDTVLRPAMVKVGAGDVTRNA